MNKVSLSKVNNKIIYLHYHYRENIQLIYNNVEKTGHYYNKITLDNHDESLGVDIILN